MIKIGDTAVSEEKVVETAAMNSPEEKSEEKSEKKSTSTKKAKSKTQSRGTGRVKLVREKEDEEISLLKKIYTLFLLSVKPPETLVFLQEPWQTSD